MGTIFFSKENENIENKYDLSTWPFDSNVQ